MPTIRVTVPQNAFNKEQKAQIATDLTASLAKVAEGAGKGDITPHINLQIDELSPDSYAVGGKVVA